jgi:hypothetical protein
VKVKIDMTLNVDKRQWLEDNGDVDKDEAQFVIQEHCKDIIINEMSDYLRS